MYKKFIRVVSLCAAIVVLIWAANALGQKSLHAAAKKPNPAPVWGAQIIDYGNLSGMGENHVYDSGDPNVRVTLQKSTTGGVVTQSTVHFFIYGNTNPPATWAKFDGVNFFDYSSGNSGPAGFCGFPTPYNQWDSPDCLLGFLNSDHPKKGYEHLLFYFVIGADLEDLAVFPMGERVPWTGSGAVTVSFWNAFDPLSASDPEPYESVTASLKNLCSDSPKGYWITRIDDNHWEIQIEQQLFTFTQFYSWEETIIGRNGKPARVITNYQPLTGSGEMSYKIRLIKNPS